MTKNTLLFFIIFLEGYVVLSSELLAIRLTIPFVGSGTDTVSIIIAAVLMPLAFGYYAGGHDKKNSQSRLSQGSSYKSIRKKLLSNIFIAFVFLAFGLSYLFIEFFFEILQYIGIHHRLFTTTIYALIFLVIPVYLLAQTIPLVSCFFSKEKLSQITGKMLFFSTVGSFMGAIFSTLVLMAFIGVHHTVVFTLSCLALLFFLLNRKNKKLSHHALIIVGLFIVVALINSTWQMQLLNIVENNKYNTIKIINDDISGERVFSMNGNRSSMIGLNPNGAPKYYKYIEFIERSVLDPIKTNNKVEEILIIGAGGFTLGLDDTENNYTFVDIDGALKDVAEEHFLYDALDENKKFEAMPARAFVREALENNKKFDVIVLDAYQGNITIPEHLTSVEFFESIKAITNDKGVVAANFIGSPTFNTHLNLNLDTTFNHVFAHSIKQMMRQPNFWDTSKSLTRNIVYVYKHSHNSNGTVYTDDKNRIYYDRYISSFNEGSEE